MAHSCKTNFMPILCPDEARREAILRGAATLFDLSGSGVFEPSELLPLDADIEALRRDYEAVGQDFWSVLREELDRIRREQNGRQS